VQVLDVY